MRIQSATVRDARTAAVALVLALLSFLAFGVLCAEDSRAEGSRSHAHISGLAHDTEPSPTERCHHHSQGHTAGELDLAPPRPGTAQPAPGSSSDDGVIIGAGPVPAPQVGPGSGRPPRSGRILLVDLGVARN